MYSYLYLIKINMINELNYRFEVITKLVENLILIVSSVFLWKTAFKGISSVSGVNESQMITYVILSSMLASIFSFGVQWNLNNKIREGEIAMDLMKPLSLLGKLFAEDVGCFITSLVSRLLPLIIVVLFFIKIQMPINSLHAALFIVSALLCYLILWYMDAMFGIMVFWLMDIGNLVGIKDVFVRLLSGSIIPIWFFPKEIQSVLNFMPFQYTYQTCLSIYIGRSSTETAVREIGIQCFWVIFFITATHLLWNKARKSIQVQGG